MSFVLLGVATFVGLIGFMFWFRFLLFALGRATFPRLVDAYVYALTAAVLLTAAVWLFSIALPGVTA